ncbi:MAG: CNP1-like family protein, partial [Sedimenticolaceae bacterium]|nr:CNP1-like family protein [Sedimenticolaceae bacterium]
SLLLAGDLHARDPFDQIDGIVDPQEFDYDETVGGIWKEQDSRIPPVSLDKLMQMQIDHGPQGVEFYLDSKSILMNEKDRITRYWLVAKNGNKLVSINFEALRCSTREYKQLAYARSGNPDDIQAIDNPRWRNIKNRSVRDHHVEIADDYLCAGSTPKTYEGVMASLKGNYDAFNPYSELIDQ